MRTIFMATLILGLTAGQALAIPTPGRGGGGGAKSFSLLVVANRCDDAVEVTVGTSEPTVLEAQSSRSFYVHQYVDKGNRGTVPVTARLVSDPSVTAHEDCAVQKGKVTTASIRCTATVDGLSLEIECSDPKVTRNVIRESAIAVASTGGLGGLMLLGTVLGRAPRRRHEHSAFDTTEGGECDIAQVHDDCDQGVKFAVSADFVDPSRRVAQFISEYSGWRDVVPVIGSLSGKSKQSTSQHSARDAGVLAASTGNLSLLVLLGTLLVRLSRRTAPGLGESRNDRPADADCSRPTHSRSRSRLWNRTAASGLALLVIISTSASAMATGRGGRDPQSWGRLIVTNTCDEAVHVVTDLGTFATLEPNSSATLLVGKSSVTVTATLVSDPSVSAVETCAVKGGTANATITCTTDATGVSLSIICGTSEKQARGALRHESTVAFASMSGLGFLMLLGTLLGRSPRRREPVDDHCENPAVS